MSDTAPAPAPPAPPAAAPGPPALIPQHHLVLIAAASAALLGPGRAITSVTPAPHASRRSSRGGLWPRLVRALTAPIRHHHQSAQRRAVPGGASASAQPFHLERSMKLRIKLENKTYEVEVEAVDSPTLGSAALRVEGSAVAAPSRPGSAKAPGRPSEPKPEPKAETKPEAPAPAPTQAAPAAKPAPKADAKPTAPPAKLPDSVKFEPVAPRPPWHGLSVGPGGECTAPVPGIVSAILVKIGDAVKPGDPLIQLEASHVVSPQEKPLAGTLRAVTAGTIAEIPVNRGDPVAFGQVLIRIKTDA